MIADHGDPFVKENGGLYNTSTQALVSEKVREDMMCNETKHSLYQKLNVPLSGGNISVLNEIK